MNPVTTQIIGRRLLDSISPELAVVLGIAVFLAVALIVHRLSKPAANKSPKSNVESAQ